VLVEAAVNDVKNTCRCEKPGVRIVQLGLKDL
jgi:hypothetical protein